MDSLAFTLLYSSHAAPLERYITRIVRDRQAASDLAHDTFLKALERPQSGPGWLYRVAHNAALDHLRKASRATPEEPGTIDSRRERSASERIEWGSAADVHAELATLPKAQRDVTLLRYRGGLSPTETGCALGKTPAAVRQLELRALRTLRNRLAEPAAGRAA